MLPPQRAGLQIRVGEVVEGPSPIDLHCRDEVVEEVGIQEVNVEEVPASVRHVGDSCVEPDRIGERD